MIARPGPSVGPQRRKIWCDSRKFFIEPRAQNLLSLMQPSEVNNLPNGELSAELNFFNMAIHALVDMNDPDADCFIFFYYGLVKNIKFVAYRMGMGRRTFYDKRDRFASKAYSLSKSLERAFVREKVMEKPELIID